MKDVLRDGQAWLAGKLKQFASRKVIYRYRLKHLLVLPATIGKTLGEQDAGDGLILRTEIRDYLIDVADLKIDGQNFLPERGDQIIEVDEGERFTYEVLPIGNQKPWRYSDPFRLKLRIHTKLVANDDQPLPPTKDV